MNLTWISISDMEFSASMRSYHIEDLSQIAEENVEFIELRLWNSNS